MSDEKCPPTEVNINIKDLKKEDGKKTQPLTDKIEGKGLSGIFYRSMDRGNSIPDMTDLDKAAHWLTALKEVGIECDDLFDTYLKIKQESRGLKSQMNIIQPTLDERQAKVSTFLKSQRHSPSMTIDIPNIDMSEIIDWRNEIESDTMKLNLNVLDRFNNGIAKIYDKDPERLTKMIVDGMV